MIRRLLWAALACAPSAALAQPCIQSAPHQLGLTLNGTIAQIRDLNFNRSRYAGFGPGALLEYRFIGCNDRVGAALGASTASIHNEAGYPLLLIDPALNASWTRAVWRTGAARVFLGAALESRPRLYNYEVEDPDHVNWFTSHALGPKVTGELSLGRSWKVSAALGVPVLALISRPPSEVDRDSDKPDPGYLLTRVHSGLGVATVDRFRAVNLEVGAEFEAGERIVHRLAWRLDASTATEPRPVHRVDNALLLSVLVRL